MCCSLCNLCSILAAEAISKWGAKGRGLKTDSRVWRKMLDFSTSKWRVLLASIRQKVVTEMGTFEK